MLPRLHAGQRHCHCDVTVMSLWSHSFNLCFVFEFFIFTHQVLKFNLNSLSPQIKIYQLIFIKLSTGFNFTTNTGLNIKLQNESRWSMLLWTTHTQVTDTLKLLSLSGAPNDDIIIVLQCLDAMLTRRKKQVSLQRAMAFVKRLSTLSLHVLPNATVGILAANRATLHVSVCVCVNYSDRQKHYAN